MARRGRGRPRKRPGRSAYHAGALLRASILDRALELTREESLAGLSILRLAASLKVQPGTIHYHLGSRENLITGVMNLFYRKLLERLAAGNPQPAWQDEIRRVGWAWLEAKLAYPGIASYVTSNDRFRVFQKPAEGEEDHGGRFMDVVFALLARAGFTPELAAECWHFMALYTNSTAENIAMKHSPAEHSAFLIDRATRYDARDFPGLAFGLTALAHLDAMAAFRRSFDDLISGFERRVGQLAPIAPSARGARYRP